MPPLKDVARVMRVYLGYTLGTDTTNITRMFFQYQGGPPTDAQAAAWANSIATSWQFQIESLCVPATVLTQVFAVDLSNTSAAAGVANVSHAGTRAGGALPAGNAFLVNYLIHRRYRGGKPRNYLPIGASTDVGTEQTWTPQFVTEVQGKWDGFLGQVVSATSALGVTSLVHVNVSYYSDFAVTTSESGRPKVRSTPRPTPLVDTIIGNFYDKNFATQRRRNRGGV